MMARARGLLLAIAVVGYGAVMATAFGSPAKTALAVCNNDADLTGVGNLTSALNDVLGYSAVVIHGCDFRNMKLTTYTQIVVAISYTVSASDIGELASLVTAGKRVVMFGGTSTSDFHSAMDSKLLAAGTSDYDWDKVKEGALAASVFHKDHPLAAGLPMTINQTDYGRNYCFKVGDAGARIALRNGDGWPALVSKLFGSDAGVFVYSTTLAEDKYLHGSAPVYLKTMLANAINTKTEDFLVKTARRPILLVEQFPDVLPSTYSSFEGLIGLEKMDLVTLSGSFSGKNWGASYATIVVVLWASTPYAASYQELAEYAQGGCRVVLFGGSSSSYFQSGMRSYLLQSDTTLSSFVTVQAKRPWLTVWHSDHPLAKNVPAVLNQSSASYYAYQVADFDARVALRNGDGFPLLVSKSFGTDGGIFVYYADSVSNSHLDEAQTPVIASIVSNAIDTPSAEFAAKTLRKKALLVESTSTTTDDYFPSIFSAVDTKLGPEQLDLLVTSTYDPNGRWGTYSTIVILVNGGSISSTSMSKLHDLCNAGVRIVLIGGSGLSSFASGMNSYLIGTGSPSDYAWKEVGSGAPAFKVWHTTHPLVKNLPASIGQDAMPKASYMAKISDLDAWVAARNGDGYPCLVSKLIGESGGVFVYATDPVDDKHLNLTNGQKSVALEYISQIVTNAVETPAAAFAKKASQSPTLLIEPSGTPPSQFSLVEEALGGGDAFDLVQSATFTATNTFNLSNYTTVVLSLNGDFNSNIVPSTASFEALRAFADAGGRLVLIGSICSTSFRDRLSSSLVAASCADSACQWNHAAKPDINVQDSANPLLAKWSNAALIHGYNFTKAGGSDICVRPVDPISWVALSSGRGQQVLSTVNIGKGALVWLALTATCSKPDDCFVGTDAELLTDIIQRAVAFPLGIVRAPICDTPIDLIIVVDGSASITSADFKLIQSFIPAIAARLDLGSARIGVVQFSEAARDEIDLTNNLTTISTDARVIKQLGSGTNTAAGLSLAQTELVLHGRDRDMAKPTMLLLSDGQSNTGNDPVHLAKALQKQGYDIYTVGVGSDINVTELQLIASEPTDLHYFKSSEYDSLYQIIDRIVDNSCVVCHGKIDSVVLMDDSNSIKDPDFRLMESFVEGIADGFDLESSSSSSSSSAGVNATTRLGVVAFADSARTIIGLSSSEALIEGAVKDITRKRGNTAIGDGINLGQSLLDELNPGGGAREKIIFLLTDGVNNRGADPFAAADAARAAGSTIYAVGVGSDVNIDHLNKIAGSVENVFTVKDFATLKAIQFTLLQRACKPDGRTTRTAQTPPFLLA